MAATSAAYPIAFVAANEPKRIIVMSIAGNRGPHRGAVVLQRRLRTLGHVDGRDFVISVHRREPDESVEAAAQAVFQLRPAIVVTGSTRPAAALRRFTSTIPIVLATSFDPVAAGLAESLARPGGNVTGITAQGQELVGKSIELIRDLLPSARRILGLRGSLYMPALARLDDSFAEATKKLGFWEARIDLDERSDGPRVRAAIAQHLPDALQMYFHPSVISQSAALIALALEERVPIFGVWTAHAEQGALASYGPNTDALWERAADYVDRILKGANPATMPIEQPTRFERVVNLRTARILGIEIPSRSWRSPTM